MIAEWQEKGIITRKQAQDHRKAIRAMIDKPMKERGNDLTEELDEKVKQAVRFFM